MALLRLLTASLLTVLLLGSAALAQSGLVGDELRNWQDGSGNQLYDFDTQASDGAELNYTPTGDIQTRDSNPVRRDFCSRVHGRRLQDLRLRR